MPQRDFQMTNNQKNETKWNESHLLVQMPNEHGIKKNIQTELGFNGPRYRL